MKPYCLTIAGSDPTSGAGIQADIRTFDRIGVHPFSVITAITYQTASEFFGYRSLSDELGKQLDVILGSYPIRYVKIGMIPDLKSLEIIKEAIINHNLIGVLDPVSISSSGIRLSSEGLELELERDLFPYITVLTPNLNEASFYAHLELNTNTLINLDKLKLAAKNIAEKLYKDEPTFEKEKSIIIKSAGSNEESIYDFACFIKSKNSTNNFEYKLYKKPKIQLKGNVHGTGCIFSSAITAYLAKEYSIKESVQRAELFFNERFQKFIEFNRKGKIIDLTLSTDERLVIDQIKEVYNYISNDKRFSFLIPEVRMNISASLPNAQSKEQIAGVEGRITIINGYPYASGDIKFGVSDHTARLILEAKKHDNSINFVMNLKYKPDWVNLIKSETNLRLREIIREEQPKEISIQEESTMQWLINKSIGETGEIPDIIWDKGSIGKEPMLRLFGKDSNDMIQKLEKIIQLL
jgi:hydroxymethylpyrimidine kinase/phosphomethylpyrimidine kinase